jgi:hypothetical protein
MNSIPVTCPYCNSLVTVTPGTTGGRQLPCPRCGESFTLLTTQTPASTDHTQQPSLSPSLPIEPGSHGNRWLLQKPYRANRRTALVLLGVMAFMGAAGLAYALYTQPFRRQNDKGIVKTNPKRRPPIDDSDSSDRPTPPAKLAALGWLPPKTNVLVGVHIRELLASPGGKALLKQPLKIGDSSVRIEEVLGWTGIKSDDLDHLVLGEKADEPFPPPWPSYLAPVTLVVRTNRDVDVEEIKDAKPTHDKTGGQRAVYQFAPANGRFPLYFCRVDNRTFVFAVLENHLNDIPATEQSDLGQLPSEVRDVLQNHVGQAGPLWCAGHSDDWKKSTALAMFQSVPLLKNVEPKDRRLLFKVSTFAVCVQPDDPVKVEAAFHCGDEQTAKELQKYFNIPDLGSDPDWGAAYGGGWLTMQVRTTMDKVRSVFQR